MEHDGDIEGDMEMREVSVHSTSSDEYSVEIEEGSSSLDLENEYGEQTITPRTVSKSNIFKADEHSNDFYKTTVRRQNCCFGLSMISFAGLFIAAYFYMGMSFTPSNIGIFGDESSMKGGSGEVGLDADNAASQEIVDKEIVDLERVGDFGEEGSKADKRKKHKQKMKEMLEKEGLGRKDGIGKHDWVENKNWWKKNAPDLDTSTMTKKEMQTYEKEKKKEKRKQKKHERFCKKNPDDKSCQGNTEGLDLDSIKEKLDNYHYESTGDSKENVPIAHNDEMGKVALKRYCRHFPEDEKCQDTQKKNASSPAEERLSGNEDVDEPLDNSAEKDNAEANQKDIVIEEETDNAQEEAPVEDTTVPEPEQTLPNTIVNTFTVIEQVKHDPSSFTQGISYGDDGIIYETSGLYHQSKVRRINPETFEVEKSVNLEGRFFGEGSAFYRDKDGNPRLIEITWREQTGYIWNAETLEKISEFKYTTTPSDGNQGWGITYDASKQEFIVSDGSVYLYFWDRDTLQEKRKVVVTRFNGNQQDELNELEFMDGLVCCNIWHDDHIICVDPVSGNSVREYDMTLLWPVSQRGSSENVLNGIALGKDHVLITGKRWDRMYKVGFPDWQAMAFE